MNSEAPLHIDWCNHDAAKYAVTHWHYSKTMPSGKLILFGVWERGDYKGSVMFGRGAIHHIGKPFGLTQLQICELVRIALRKHNSPVSRIMAICLRKLKSANPGLRAVVSYADSEQGHHGGIYQATNWVYVGSNTDAHVVINGKVCHPRSVNAKYGTRALPWLRKHVDPNAYMTDGHPKHKYVMPLDAQMAIQLKSMSKPYPKRAVSIDTDATTFQVVEGGEAPTTALHSADSKKSFSNRMAIDA